MHTIYIVEDNEVILDGITQYLKLSGFSVKGFLNIHTIRKELETLTPSTLPDLILLDVMLPDGDGFTLAQSIRRNASFPIIFLTARDSESDRIMGFELGADDYIVKPFSPKELVMRIQAVLRRIQKRDANENGLNRWELDGHILEYSQDKHMLQVDNTPITLTGAEWRILTHLIDNSEIVITREQLLQHCLDYSFDVSDRIIDTHIKNIRAKLPTTGWIKTIRGYGYQFLAVKTGKVPQTPG